MSPESAIVSRNATVGIIGLGYVGLPLAGAFLNKGFRVLGFDADPKKVESLAAGRSYIRHIPSEVIAGWNREGRFSATTDMARLSEPDVILICVPTPLDKARDPDLSYVEGTARSIAAALRPGQLVVLESTTYPTTTRDVVRPLLEAGGLKAGRDFYLAYSPEREDPGNPNFSAANIPKVVGGIDPESGRLAALLYGQAMAGVVPVSSAEVAEACKILENTYRAVNIALVNELKVLFDRMGIDVWEVIDAAKTKPFGFQAFYPGPGLGGHCIPIDPFYLTWLARTYGMTTRFIELAGEVNHRMPDYVVSRLGEFLNEQGKPIKGSKILILGMAYKKDVDDPRESPSFELFEKLMHLGAKVTYHDPYIPSLPPMRNYDLAGVRSADLTADMLAGLDAVLIATDHSNVDYSFVVRHAPLVVDTRNATREVSAGREKIRRA
ncbi:MAG TPA: nucleotide sugar dehydrogenase [Planctomycetaceae bacterium]